MVRLKDDTIYLTRRGGPSSRTRRVRLALPLLIFASIGLMLLSRLDHSALAEARWRLAAWMSPVLQTVTIPLEPLRRLGRHVSAQIDLSSELERLRLENQKLSSWQWRARELEKKLADLEALSKVVAEPKLNFVTTRVIADSSGAFVRSVMIDAGERQNVKPGYPVINADGLVGRVVETGTDSARVLLATDLNSRIPVVIGPNQVRAILAGDNGSRPHLTYVPPNSGIAIGDEVATSGTGGLFPRGLRIGTVTQDLADPEVDLRADLDQLEYLSVLFYDDPTRTLLEETQDVRGRERASSGDVPHAAKSGEAGE